MAIIGGGTMVLLGLGMKPESMPLASFTQGVSKVDCVTVWFWDWKTKTTESPMAALRVSGTKTRPAVPPTATCTC